MRILISGGGTGGHVYPALAVASYLRNIYNAEILYMGSDDGLETQLVPAAGFRLAKIKAGKLQRYASLKSVKHLMRVPIGLTQAIGVVREFKPDVTFSSGGYVAVPAGFASRLYGVPLLLHQQDVPPNLANKLLAPVATRISVAFADSLKYFPANKTSSLGNPVRQEILDVRHRTSHQARKTLGFSPVMPLVLITGGSQGALHLNQVAVRALPELLKQYQVLIITGQKHYEETRRLADAVLAESITKSMDATYKQRVKLLPYMTDDMPQALQAAELIVCRAGAATLSELTVLEKPNIVVPLPPAIGSSPQEINADTFGSAQASEVIRDDALTEKLLADRVQLILNSPERINTMVNALRSFARPQATQEIAAAVVDLVRSPSPAVPAPQNERIDV